VLSSAKLPDGVGPIPTSVEAVCVRVVFRGSLVALMPNRANSNLPIALYASWQSRRFELEQNEESASTTLS